MSALCVRGDPYATVCFADLPHGLNENALNRLVDPTLHPAIRACGYDIPQPVYPEWLILLRCSESGAVLAVEVRNASWVAGDLDRALRTRRINWTPASVWVGNVRVDLTSLERLDHLRVQVEGARVALTEWARRERIPYDFGTFRGWPRASLALRRRRAWSTL